MSQNLAKLPEKWGQYPIFGDVKYDGDPQIIHVDYAVLHNGEPSIRIDAHVPGVDQNNYREVNADFIPCKPGDHVIFKAWVKTGHSTLGQDGVYGNGGLILFDYYSATHRLHEHSSDNPLSDVQGWDKWNTYINDPARYVPYNSDWVLRTLETIVPSQVLDDNTQQLAIEPIVGIIPCFVAGSHVVGPDKLQDQGTVWFADAELYINPTVTPSTVVITVLLSLEGGTTEPPAGAYEVSLGSVFSVTAQASQGYRFRTWFLDGVDQDPWLHLVETINISTGNDHSVYAAFEPITSTPPPSGCFIATACYGSPTHIRVCELRAIKNGLVARSTMAQWLYRLYYVFSPSIANVIRERENLKKPIRKVIERWVKANV